MGKGILVCLKNSRILLASWFVIIFSFFYLGHEQLHNFHSPFFADTSSMLVPAEKMLRGQLPFFGARTAGYPIFIAFIKLFSPSARVISIIQTILLSVACCIFITSISKLNRYLVLPLAILLSLYCLHNGIIGYSVYLLTESLTLTVLLLASATMIYMVQTPTRLNLFTTSLLFGYCVWIRPDTMSLASAYILIGIFLSAKKCMIKKYFLLPFPIVLLLLASYNKATINYFGLSASAPPNFAAATSFGWEPSKQYTDAFNQFIKNKIYPRGVEREKLKNTGIFDVMNNKNIFTDINFTHNWGAILQYFNDKYRAKIKKNVTDLNILDANNAHEIMYYAYAGIKQSPKIYLKYFITQFTVNMQRTFIFPYRGTPAPFKAVALYLEGAIWLVIFLLGFLYNLLKCLYTKFQDPLALLYVCFAGIGVGRIFLLSLVMPANGRYYLSSQLLPFLAIFVLMIQFSKVFRKRQG